MEGDPSGPKEVDPRVPGPDRSTPAEREDPEDIGDFVEEDDGDPGRLEDEDSDVGTGWEPVEDSSVPSLAPSCSGSQSVLGRYLGSR